ncbi:glucose-1-phosphate thymidylyltransferase [Streptomyces sp. NPDC096205]|uniref:glucose-1-phosphate thymidylyltransferase n=1 Tax=Streptomyces sp. NPDC096205 TaxID=3366081 RepID=UPI00380A6948
MKALVLAGGAGTRLRPITHTSAKQLVPIANKPVLFYGLEAIADAGIKDVGVIVGDTAAEVRRAVGDGSDFGLRVTCLPQPRPLGLAHAVLIARDFLGDDDFLMYLGDNFIVGGIGALLDEFRAHRPDAQLLLTRVPDPSAYGVATLSADGRVTDLREKPERPASDLAIVGVYLFTPAIHEAVRAIAPSERGELEITDALRLMLAQGRDIRPTVITGYWKDTGTVADILEANRRVLEVLEPAVEGSVSADSELVGRVRVCAGAVVRGSRIVGPALIGAGSAIVNSYVGPSTSIAENCRIEDSEIEFSIVLSEATITGVRRIDASLIGCHAQVAPAPRVPTSHRLVLGDHSTVRIAS